MTSWSTDVGESFEIRSSEVTHLRFCEGQRTHTDMKAFCCSFVFSYLRFGFSRPFGTVGMVVSVDLLTNNIFVFGESGLKIVIADLDSGCKLVM